jgi:hypothetical protein
MAGTGILSEITWFRKLTNPALTASFPKSDNFGRSASTQVLPTFGLIDLLLSRKWAARLI